MHNPSDAAVPTTHQEHPNNHPHPTPHAPCTHPPLFDYTSLAWNLDEEPDLSIYPPTQLFHIYLTSGHLLISLWSSNYRVAPNTHTSTMHIVGWAPVANNYPVQ